MTALEIVQKTVRERLPEGGFAIDATAGRGHDTVFLARTVGKSGRVLAFDIQQAAVDSTRALLEKEGLTAEVVLASHADMASYAEPASADCIPRVKRHSKSPVPSFSHSRMLFLFS